MTAGLLMAAACSDRSADNDVGNGGSDTGMAINRADDAPGNAASAPVPVSGSGDVPPNAPANDAGG
ncbi:hypothetical protein M529_12140 [Sphingobium ummariense RL-3]|uniref:Uncharacterized protein n=2 Tax=Sphingobium TaxID=165695 RepID=T0KEQ6_9SPHN|nr:hypothetical protein M529_12140 [Sphingobium ummariense RL-3]